MGNQYIKKETAHCMICGMPTKMHALICARCRKAGEIPRRPKTENEHKIAIINAAARSRGLSYGQYVGRFGTMEL